MSNSLERTDSRYPRHLDTIKDPPKQLFYEGDVSLLHTTCISVCGSRQCTPYGREVARRIGLEAAASGVTVVSGMAVGVDAAAHRGALEGGGKTIAVLACGVDVCYPPENRALFRQIREKGLLLSEYADGQPPIHYRFPARNRIISALSVSTVVVEAANRSGALITAEFAADQGRVVYAVPGNILDQSSAGCNHLIEDGAIPLVDPAQVLRDMGIAPVLRRDSLSELGGDEKTVFEIISRHGAITVDAICCETLLPPKLVNGIISLLEMKGLVRTSMDKVFLSVMGIK